MSDEKNIEKNDLPAGGPDQPAADPNIEKLREEKNAPAETTQPLSDDQPSGTKEKKKDNSTENEDKELKHEQDTAHSSGDSHTQEITPPIIQPTTENMETHAHELHKAPGHGWKHYLFEFLMLFLAVTLGFFVENIREHFVERTKERAYILSIKEDLQEDISQLDSIIIVRRERNMQMDSLLYLLNYDDPKKHGNEIYYYTRWLPRTYRFYSADRTIAQLKNAGNWRLIEKQKVSDQLIAYDNLIRDIAAYTEQREESLVLISYSSINKLFDNRVFEKMVNGLNFDRPTDNPQLLSYDKTAINEFCNQVHFRKNSNNYFIATAEMIRKEAKKTLSLIKEEYGLD